MKILLNTKMLMCSPRTGVGRYVINLYNELLNAGIDVVPSLGVGSSYLFSSASRASAQLRTTLGRYYPPFVRKASDALYRQIMSSDISAREHDLYHETSTEPFPVLKTKVICNIYDLSFIRFPDFFADGFAANARKNIAGNARSADGIIVTSRFIRDEVIEALKVPEEKIDVIPLAATGSLRKMRKPSSERKDVRRYTEKDYILYVGTVEPRKNLKTLIRAFRRVRAKFDVALIIAGTLGWLYDDIVSYPGELGLKQDVIFTNYVNDRMIASLYHHASVFVYPSLYEGFGMPPLEAMSCGLPVVVSDIPPFREVAGDSAVFFNPVDHESLAHALERVLSSQSLMRELKKKSRDRAGAFSWEKVAADTIGTYKRALSS